MKYDVYCDESRPDLFSSNMPPAKFMVIGSLWLETDRRNEFKQALHELRDKFHIGGEFKWQKASPSKKEFYNEIINWFFEKGDNLRFRCIVIDYRQVDLIRYHENDQELGFYKFYYQMLHHWILDFNQYSIFCDYKSNRRNDRLKTLGDCLMKSNLSSEILTIQAVRSAESVLIQLCDVLTGAASARLNNSLQGNSAKEQVVLNIERHIARRIEHTLRSEQKFNVFVIDLRGGW